MAAMLALKLSPHGLSRFVAPCHRQFFYVQLTDWRGSHSVNRTWLVTAFFFALLLLILYCAFLILTPFLTAITWAAILAILFYPVYAGLLELMRGRATLAAMTVIVVITIIVIAPCVELARFLADEAVSLLQSVRLLLDEGGKQQWLAQPWVQHLIGWWDMATFRLVDFKIDWKNLLIQGAQSSSTFIVTQVKGIAQNVLLFTVNFIVALFTLFFFLRDGAGAARRLGLLVFRCPVRGIVGRGHGLCLAVAGGWVGDRFDTGRDLLVSPGRNGARSRAVGLVLGIYRHGGQYSRRFSSAIVSACRSYFSFSASLAVFRFSAQWGSCSARALLALLRALLDLYSEEYSNIERP